MPRNNRHTSLPPPYLKRVWIDDEAIPDRDAYPFCLPMFRAAEFRAGVRPAGHHHRRRERHRQIDPARRDRGGRRLRRGRRRAGLPRRSTISKRSRRAAGCSRQALKAAWLPKVGQRLVLPCRKLLLGRALSRRGGPRAYGPPPDFLSHSHGEGFMRFFEERCQRPGIFIFDEPESALSMTRQFDFLKLLRRMQEAGNSQVIMATHSPILMALPERAAAAAREIWAATGRPRGHRPLPADARVHPRPARHGRHDDLVIAFKENAVLQQPIWFIRRRFKKWRQQWRAGRSGT